MDCESTITITHGDMCKAVDFWLPYATRRKVAVSSVTKDPSAYGPDGFKVKFTKDLTCVETKKEESG